MNQISAALTVDGLEEWDARWTSFTRLVNRYKRYRETGRLPERISQEGIVEITKGIIGKVREFFTWLKDMLLKFWNKVTRFFRVVINWVRRHILGKFSSNSVFSMLPASTDISVQYDVDRINKTCLTVISKYYPRYSIKEVDLTNEEASKTIQSDYEALVGDLKKSLTRGEDSRQMNVSKFSQTMDRIYLFTLYVSQNYSPIDKFYAQLTSEISAFAKSSLDEDNVLAKMEKIADDIFKRCGDFFKFLGHKFTSGDASDIRGRYLNQLNAALRIVNVIVRYGADMYATVNKWLVARYKDYACDKNAVNMTVPIPDFLRKHLETQYKLKFSPRKIHITSLSALTWGSIMKALGRKTDSYYGLFMNTGGMDTIVINASTLVGRYHKYHRSNINRDLDNHGKIDSSEMTLLDLIVHEMRHLADAQNGIKDDDPDSPYEELESEKRAFKEENDYVPTSEELAWAKKIVDAVTSQYKGKDSQFEATI